MPPKRAKKIMCTEMDRDDFDLDSLSEEGQLIVAALSYKLDKVTKDLSDLLKAKDQKIEMMEQEIINMKHTVHKLEEGINDTDAYERRDTLIFSGESVPV